MRNKLLITAAIGTIMSTAVFAQSSTTMPAPAPAGGTATGTTMPVPPAASAQPGITQGTAQPGTQAQQPAPRTTAPSASAQPAESSGERASRAEPSAPAPRNFSTRASNILPSDTRSNAAPVLPTPPSGDNGSPQQLLRDARAALDRGQTGLAQEAMERAEARVLSRSMPSGAVSTPVQGPVVDKLKDARHALGRNDIAASRALLEEALTALNKSAMN